MFPEHLRITLLQQKRLPCRLALVTLWLQLPCELVTTLGCITTGHAEVSGIVPCKTDSLLMKF